MTKLEQLIEQLCPDGVEYKTIEECTIKTKKIKWSDNQNADFQYIDLTSVDRDKHIIIETQTINSDKAPSRAQQIVKHNDIIFGTTRPTLMRYCYVPKQFDNQICSTGFCVIRSNNRIVLNEWLYHNVSSSKFYAYVECKQKGASYPAISDKEVKQYKIPVPPIEVQAEIVRILDKFTELTTELTAELTARKKQYEYYRDSLLSYNGILNADVKTVGELSKFRRGSFPQPYGNKEWYDGEGAMPFVQVADIGDNMRLVENTKRKISILAQPKSVFAPKGSIIISLQGSIGRIAVTQYDAFIDRTVAIFSDISDRLLPKYFVYQLQRIFSIKEKTARGSTIKTITKEEFTTFPIPILPLTEQQRIVDKLDRFDKLCNDISEGLPAEIEARQKQYEYYRDKLLSFNCK